MYEGIEDEIGFSWSQLVGAKLAAQYMEAVANLQKFKKNLPKDKNSWTPTQKEKKIELMELVQHYLGMPVILEFNKLIAHLLRQKRDQT